VAAGWHQASADENHIGRGIEIEQLAERVEKQNLRTARARILAHAFASPSAGVAAGSPLERNTALLEQCAHLRKSRRMPRRKHEQRIRVHSAHLRMRLEGCLLLALMGAARDPHRPAAGETLTQAAPVLGGLGWNVEVEFDVADHAHGGGRCAEPPESLGIRLALCSNERAAGERRLDERRHPPIAARRALGKPRARKRERHAAAAAFMIEIGPELGLHDDADARCGSIEEAAYRARHIDRQKPDICAGFGPGAEQRTGARRARRRRGRDDECRGRDLSRQRAREPGARLHLADRSRVQPQAAAASRRAGAKSRPESEALAESVPVPVLLESPPRQSPQIQGCE